MSSKKIFNYIESVQSSTLLKTKTRFRILFRNKFAKYKKNRARNKISNQSDSFFCSLCGSDTSMLLSHTYRWPGRTDTKPVAARLISTTIRWPTMYRIPKLISIAIGERNATFADQAILAMVISPHERFSLVTSPWETTGTRRVSFDVSDPSSTRF